MKLTNSAPKIAVALAALAAIGAGAGITAIASAQSTDSTATAAQRQERPGVMGEVASISGTTMTVTGRDGTTYTVDVSGAKVMMGRDGAAPAAGSVSDIKVGDTVGVRGTVSGTSVSATEVMDGLMRGGPHGGRGPGVHGTVSAINGTTLTITNDDGTSYAVDASNASVSKMVDLTVSDIKVGDTVGVTGKVSGTEVTAQHIMDGMPANPQAPPPGN